MTRAVVLACVLAAALPARADVSLDEIVAVVDARSITRSELEVEAHLHRAFTEGAQMLTRPLDEATLASAFEHLVDDLVVHAEAERLQVFRVADTEVTAALTGLEARLGGPAFQKFLAEYELDDRSLAEIVERQMRVARYLEGRFRLAARPRDADVRAFYEAHRSEFGDLVPDAALESIRLRMQRERLAELSRAFVADVRQRAKVRVLRGFGPRSDEARRSGAARADDAARGAARGARPR